MKGGPCPPDLFVGMQLTKLADSRWQKYMFSDW